MESEFVHCNGYRLSVIRKVKARDIYFDPHLDDIYRVDEKFSGGESAWDMFQLDEFIEENPRELVYRVLDVETGKCHWFFEGELDET